MWKWEESDAGILHSIGKARQRQMHVLVVLVLHARLMPASQAAFLRQRNDKKSARSPLYFCQLLMELALNNSKTKLKKGVYYFFKKIWNKNCKGNKGHTRCFTFNEIIHAYGRSQRRGRLNPLTWTSQAKLWTCWASHRHGMWTKKKWFK